MFVYSHPGISIHACHPSSYFVFTSSPSYLSLNRCKQTLPRSRIAEMFDWWMYFKLGLAWKWNDIIHKVAPLCSCTNSTLSRNCLVSHVDTCRAAHCDCVSTRTCRIAQYDCVHKYLQISVLCVSTRNCRVARYNFDHMYLQSGALWLCVHRYPQSCALWPCPHVPAE